MTVPAMRSAAFPTCHGSSEAVVRHEGIAETEFGAMPFACGLAWNLLCRTGVAWGERVLVIGASGAVGLAAVHLAIRRGARVTGQCPPGLSAPVRAAGAVVLDRDTLPDAMGFDVVIDVIGGSDGPARRQALRPGGRYAAGGAVNEPLATGDRRTIHLNDLTPFGGAHPPREVFAGLVTVITTARIRLLVSNPHPLRDITRTMARRAALRNCGKLVLIPEASDP